MDALSNAQLMSEIQHSEEERTVKEKFYKSEIGKI